jgi:hypothetical protein
MKCWGRGRKQIEPPRHKVTKKKLFFFLSFVSLCLGGFLLHRGCARRSGEALPVLAPTFDVALEDFADEFVGVGEFSAAGSREHHPAQDEGLADVAVGGIRREIFEEALGCRFLDGAPDFEIALEDFPGASFDIRKRAGFFGIFAPEGVEGLADEVVDAVRAKGREELAR